MNVRKTQQFVDHFGVKIPMDLMGAIVMKGLLKPNLEWIVKVTMLVGL